MDAAQPRPSSEIVVKIPRSKLKGCEELWTKGAKIKETYKKNVGEKMRNDCDEGEDDEEEPTVPITHFKKRLIRAHSASAAPIQNPSKSNDDWPRVGRHHLPATTPVGPTHRRRSQNSIDLTHKKDNQDPHQSLEREFPKVLDNFLALIEAIRDYSCFNDHKQIISAGIVDVESFLRKCNHIATNYPLSGDQDNFNSLLECIRDFTRKIREMIFDDKVITGPILTPIEEKFYKNVFYRVFEHLSPKFDLASVNCIIWNRVHILDSTKMIVVPLNSSKSPNLLHPQNSSSVSSEMAANARKVNGSIAIGGLESLSKKGSLNPNEYVDELKKLKNLTDIPDDFKSFYMYLTKTQILNQHNPIGFLLFMELFNEKGLGLQYKGYKEYLRRKDKTISPPIIPYHLLFQHYGESPQNVPINLIVSDSHPVSTSAPSLINSNPNKFIPPPNNLPLLPTPVPLIPQSSHHHLPPTPPPSLPPTPSVQIRKS